MNELKPESTERQINRLESKVNLLTRLSITQTVILSILLVMRFMPSPSTILVLALIVIAFVVVFHKYIPSWAGWVARAGRLFFRDSNSNNSSKESL